MLSICTCYRSAPVIDPRMLSICVRMSSGFEYPKVTKAKRRKSRGIAARLNEYWQVISGRAEQAAMITGT
jgi:hypothetical protein